MTSTWTTSVDELAIELIAPRKYHQSFKLPATATHGAARVTYGIAGKVDGDDVPTILFCGGMFGSRWQAVYQNHIAEREGVRIVYIDRPGFGGTDAVPVTRRLAFFLEVVPALLNHLSISKIHIASQSAGTIFALNLLVTNPHLLNPTNPSVTLFSPFVHQSISGVTFLTAAAMLPDVLLNQWSALTGFMINSLMPGMVASSGALSAVGSLFSWSSVASGSSPAVNVQAKKAEAEALRTWEEERCVEVFGVGLQVKQELDRLVMKYAFTEECRGGNDEARLCLKTISGTSWGAVESYESLVQSLAEVWKEKVKVGSPQLTVRVLLAEEDAMIGDKGREYMEKVWTKEKCGEGIDVEVITLDGTDHDSVLDPTRGAMGEYYKAVRDGKAAFISPGEVIIEEVIPGEHIATET